MVNFASAELMKDKQMEFIYLLQKRKFYQQGARYIDQILASKSPGLATFKLLLLQAEMFAKSERQDEGEQKTTKSNRNYC